MVKTKEFVHADYVWSVDIGGAIVGVHIFDRDKRCYILPEWALGELRTKIRQHFNQ